MTAFAPEPPTRRQRPAVAAQQEGLTRQQVPAPATAGETDYIPPALYEKYTVAERLGAGGEAVVYLARPVDDPGETVALKVYRRGEPFDVSLREKLDKPQFHRHVPKLVAYGIERVAGGIEIGWEAMEYFPLGTLSDLARRLAGPDGVLRAEQLRPIMVELVDALSFWETTIRQRQTDLSPGNILVRADGPPPQLVLGDFGGVRSAGLSQRFGVSAKAVYMSPEAFAGVNDAKGPYWSLGVVCFQLLTGGVIYGDDLHENTRTALIILEDPDLSGLPDQRWRDLVAGLLTKRPANRWGDPEVRRWLAGETVPVLRPVPVTEARNPITFNHRQYTDPVLLAEAMTEAGEDAAAWLSGYGAARLREWLAEDLGNREFDRHQLLGVDRSRDAARMAVAAFAAHFAPATQPRYRGEPVDRAGLVAMAADADRHGRLAEVIRSGVLAHAARHACGHAGCARTGDDSRCAVLDPLTVRVRAAADRARADLASVPAAPRSPEARQTTFPATWGPSDDRLTAIAVLTALGEGRLRQVRWQARPFEPWWRNRRRAALAADTSTVDGCAAVVAAVALRPDAAAYRKAGSAVFRSRIADRLAASGDAGASAGSRVARWLHRRSERAGDWLVVWWLALLVATIDLLTVAPFTREWPRPDPAQQTAALRAATTVNTHTPAWMTEAVDVVRVWPAAVASGPAWLAAAVVLGLLGGCLFVARRANAVGPGGRIARVGAAFTGRFVMVLLLADVVATGSASLLTGPASLHFGVLVGAVVATIVAANVAGGRRRNLDAATRGSAAGRLFTAVVSIALLLGLFRVLPLPPLRPVVDLPGTAGGARAVLLTDQSALFATTAADTLTVTAVGRGTRQRQWTQRVPLAAQPDRLGLRSSANVLFARPSRAGAGPTYALDVRDGALRWQWPDGEIFAFQNLVLGVDAAGSRMTAMTAMTGQAVWAAAVPPGSRLFWRLAEPGPFALDDGSTVVLDAVLTVDAAGSVRIVRADGRVLAARDGLVPGAGDVALVGDRLVAVTAGGGSYQVTGYAVGNLAVPAWTFQAPAGADRPKLAGFCGTDRVCVADGMGLRVLDAVAGTVTGEVPGRAESAFALGTSIVVSSSTGTSIVDSAGTVVRTLDGQRAYPLDGRLVLLVSGDRPDREVGRDVALFDLVPRRRWVLGRASLRPDGCASNGLSLACAGSTLRLWDLGARF